MATFQVAPPEQMDFSKPEGWQHWIKRFERFRVASNLHKKDGESQVNTLMYCMGQKADEILPSFELTDEQLKEYVTVKEKFDNHFIIRRNVIFERAQFNVRCRSENESVDSFITALYSLAEHCQFGTLREELIRDRIVVGLLDAKLSERLQMDADLSLDKAVKLARQSEQIKRQQAGLRTSDKIVKSSDSVDAVKFRKKYQKSGLSPLSGSSRWQEITSEAERSTNAWKPAKLDTTETVQPQQPMGHQQPPIYPNMMHVSPYSQPPPQLQPIPTVQQQQQQIHQQPTGARQRQKKIIRIMHPYTKEDVTSEVSDVPSEFALKVAAAIGGTVKTRLTNQWQDSQPIMMNQSPAMMQQMQDHQIVGSPNMSAPIHAGYMGMPQIPPSQSPRPPAVQATQMMMSPYAPPMQGTGAPPSHFSAPMLSSSTSHTMAAPSPMSMPQTINEPPLTAYQLPPQNQLYGTSPRTGPSPLIRPDKVHTIRPQPANIVTNEQTAIMSQQPPGHPAQPTVPQFHPKVQTTQIQQPPPVQQDLVANVSVPMVHEVSGSSVDEALSSQPKPVVASSQPIASEKKARTIKYKEDQWSPHNPSGKKQYDRNFLLQFQYKPTSLEKPKDLPDIDIVLTHPHKKIAVPMQPMDYDFITPQYMQRRVHRPPARQRSQDHRRSGRGSMSGPGGQKIIQKVVSIDRTEVELKRSTNAWKPAKLDTSNVPTEDKEALEVERAVRSILNKLTPSTFPDLVKEVLALKIDHEKKLRRAIDLVFEKAIDEPNFCEVYAKLCRRMTALHVLPDPSPDQEQQVSPQPVEFRKLLLTKCQREFEKEKSDQEHLLEMKKKMEENTNMEIAAQLKEEYQITEMKERRRTLGNIRFIGELFKLRMLTENIMHNCIMSLFKARDGDHLESLCRLLTTIGKDLDHVKGQKRMDQYFDQIQRIITEKRTSSRVRFMLQDVYDLRLNSWTPRAIKAQGPKTITQIHQDAKDEQALEQLKIANASSPATATMKQQSGRSANRMGSRGHGVEDGWTKVQTPKPTRYDPTKMKLKPNTFDDVNKVTLGPPTRGFGGWKSGSGGSGVTKTGSGNYSPSSSMDRTPDASGRSNTPTSMVNRFSVFGQAQGEMDYQRRQAGRQSSREGTRSGSRGSMGPPTSGGRTPRRDERTSLLETARKLTSTDKTYNARQSSRESSPSMKPRASTPPQQQQLEQQQPVHKYNTDLDEEKMQTKSKSIIEEFLSILDYKEATECIAELNAPPSMMFSLVFVAHDFSLEKNYEARTNVGKLMAHLLKRGKLSSEQYVKGLLDVLDLAIDNEIDIPKVWQYYAEQMSPVFEEDSDVTLSCLIELAAPLQEVDRALIFVAEIVKAITKRMPMEAFVQQWQRSNMSWSKLSGKNDKQAIDQFLSKHRLEDLADTVGSGVSESKELQYRYEQSINRLLLQSESSNEKIFEWVDATIPREDLVKPAFIRALTISVCRNAINRESMTIFKNKMERWSIVLKKYLDTNPERELQALYGLQELMVELEQPPNLLRLFFDDLYDKDVILEQSFDNWEKSDDPNEQEGRGVAVASANPFFTWLRTAEAESDGEN